MIRISAHALAGAALAALTACGGQPAAPQGEVTLSSLRFTPSAVSAGQPLVLVATVAVQGRATPQAILVTSTSGAQEEVRVSPWDSLSDSALTSVIAEAGGRVGIGFKEAEAARGLDEDGRSTTSDSTVVRMKQWLRDQGIVITWESVLIPSVAATMQPEETLVSRVRHHPNIDYLEPVLPGSYAASLSAGVASGASSTLVAVVATGIGRGAAAFRVAPGDRVTAHYRQPDGSVLEATAAVYE